MSKRWTIPKWMKKYKSYIKLAKSLYENEGYREELTVKELEYFYNDESTHKNYEVVDFLEYDRIMTQVKLLERLHKKGIIK